MSNHMKPGLPPYDWEQFKSQFKKIKSPDEFQHVPELDLSWLDHYLEGMFEKSGSDSREAEVRRKEFHYNLYETENEVIVRVPIPTSCNVKRVRVWVELNKLVLAGVVRQKQVIYLPSKVYWNQSSALYREGMLELRLTKDKKKDYKEIPIQFDR